MNVYVGNLSCTVNEGDLEILFHGVADIVFLRLVSPLNTDLAARGYAFVAFRRDADAQAAIEGLDGAYLKGAYLHVRPVGRRVAAANAAPQPVRRRPRFRVIQGRRAAVSG